MFAVPLNSIKYLKAQDQNIFIQLVIFNIEQFEKILKVGKKLVVLFWFDDASLLWGQLFLLFDGSYLSNICWRCSLGIQCLHDKVSIEHD